jgi:hypothetical protein
MGTPRPEDHEKADWHSRQLEELNAQGRRYDWRRRALVLATPGPSEQRAIGEGRAEDTMADVRRELEEEIAREDALQVRRAVATAAVVRRVRTRVRPRERRQTRRRATRAGPSGDDDPDPEPPASPFQAAHRVLLRLTARELDTLADIAARRALVLRAGRWAA